MVIQVEIDKKSGQRSGDWIVRNGPGGRIISRHRTKRRAVQKGRQEARSRGTSLKIQGVDGTWRQGPSY